MSHLTSSNGARIVQLFNKTNQLNLSTRRLSQSEIATWCGQPGNALLAISASDQFGDMGLVGIVGLQRRGDEGHVIDLILSCRVMGRRVEEAIIHIAASKLRAMGASRLTIEYLPTPRNRPTLDVLKSVGLPEVSPNRFQKDTLDGIARPLSVSIEFDPGVAW